MQQERELGETRQCRTEEHPEAVDAVVEAAAAALPLADVREERPHRPANNKKLMDRIRDQKNRTVQRLLVALHLAKPSVDLQYKQRQQELACDIERLQASRQLIQDYVDQIVRTWTSVMCTTSFPLSQTDLWLLQSAWCCYQDSGGRFVRSSDPAERRQLPGNS